MVTSKTPIQYKHTVTGKIINKVKPKGRRRTHNRTHHQLHQPLYFLTFLYSFLVICCYEGHAVTLPLVCTLAAWRKACYSPDIASPVSLRSDRVVCHIDTCSWVRLARWQVTSLPANFKMALEYSHFSLEGARRFFLENWKLTDSFKQYFERETHVIDILLVCFFA